MIVYPRIIPIAQLGLPTHSPQVVLPTPPPIFEDPSRITGLRTYRWGDNPRRIHWPATAATRQVMVKQFQPAIARESTLFLNMNRLDYPRKERGYALELAIIAAASLAHHTLTHENLPAGFDTVALDPLAGAVRPFAIPPGKEPGQLMQILEVLARIRPIEEGDFAARLRAQAVRLSWGATVVVIGGGEEAGLVETLLWLRRAGFNPVLALVGRPHPRAWLSRFPVPTFEIWREKDIEAWQATF
ncbi:MAG: DUF58 domain-containing protein [Caldilineae bacterium]|nr:MAG: DUF58 domain-containing protein [Caldilineae bacterium]